ncbi:hypothetical protein MAR_021583 [Mya arenaria]|uniref:Uncharacterized protein n=1 Tax=Mya arenaria TaxID=6604 RepID=A0ABY7ECU5_MYAAR|nr:hypothetical protein MAR_021583 [Mya arenaria]
MAQSWEDSWHCKIDIIIGEVQAFLPADNSDDDGESFTLDNEAKTGGSFNEGEFWQILAETITYSFLKNNENKDVTLISSIAISKNSFKCFFYDSEEDVLLQSGGADGIACRGQWWQHCKIFQSLQFG